MEPLDRFKALAKADQEKILDKHRYDEIRYFEWWDFVYESFKEDMKDVGIEVEDMYFSGFASQGDGACFAGKIYDWDLFLKDQPKYTKLLSVKNDLVFFCRHSGHYYHEYCTVFWEEINLGNEFNRTTERLQYDACEIRNEAMFKLFDDFVKDATEQFRSHMRDLYKRLEEEHDYLTSDEAVLERLHANDQLEDKLNELAETTEDLADTAHGC